jgi:hypothetical protein
MTQCEDEQSEPLSLKHIPYTSACDRLNTFRLDDCAPRVVTLGRASDNTFVIAMRDVSQQLLEANHASVERRVGANRRAEWWLQDLGSQHGTYLNGVRLAPRVPVLLSRGDRVSMAGNEYMEHYRTFNPYQFKVVTDDMLVVRVPENRMNVTEKQLVELKEKLSCGACNDWLLQPYTMECGHSSCQDCLYKLFCVEKAKRCPRCSERPRSQECSAIPAHALQDVIALMVEPKLSLRQLELRKDRVDICDRRKEYKLRRLREELAAKAAEQAQAPAQAQQPVAQAAAQPQAVPPPQAFVPAASAAAPPQTVAKAAAPAPAQSAPKPPAQSAPAVTLRVKKPVECIVVE